MVLVTGNVQIWFKNLVKKSGQNLVRKNLVKIWLKSGSTEIGPKSAIFGLFSPFGQMFEQQAGQAPLYIRTSVRSQAEAVGRHRDPRDPENDPRETPPNRPKTTPKNDPFFSSFRPATFSDQTTNDPENDPRETFGRLTWTTAENGGI